MSTDWQEVRSWIGNGQWQLPVSKQDADKAAAGHHDPQQPAGQGQGASQGSAECGGAAVAARQGAAPLEQLPGAADQGRDGEGGAVAYAADRGDRWPGGLHIAMIFATGGGKFGEEGGGGRLCAGWLGFERESQENVALFNNNASLKLGLGRPTISTSFGGGRPEICMSRTARLCG